MPTVHCPAQTAPRTVDSALALALDTASARIRSSTLHQPRSILCHRLCRAPIGDVPGSDPTARPPCVCTSALLLRRRHIRFPLGTSFHPRRFEKAQARSGPASGPASGPSPGTTRPNPAMAQATSQLSAPCGWNSKAQPLAPASMGPRKIPRPPRRPLAHVPPYCIGSRASVSSENSGRSCGSWLQSILTEPQGARPALGLLVQRIHWTTHDDNSSRLARCRQLASSFGIRCKFHPSSAESDGSQHPPLSFSPASHRLGPNKLRSHGPGHRDEGRGTTTGMGTPSNTTTPGPPGDDNMGRKMLKALGLSRLVLTTSFTPVLMPLG